MINLIILLLVGVSVYLFINNKKLKKALITGDKEFLLLLNENMCIKDSFQQEIKLEKLFIFYIGDYFHNFGPNNWKKGFKEEDDFLLKKETCYFIQNIFVAIRYTNSHNLLLILENSLNLLDLTEELNEDVRTLFKEINDFERKKLIYQLIILAMKKNLPDITDGLYSFSNEEMFPKTLDQILNQKIAIWNKV